MISNIRLDNFKAFEEVEVNPKLVTIFIGPNGAGKSTIAQALLLLKQSCGYTQLQPGPPVELGAWNELLHHPKKDGEFTIHFEVIPIPEDIGFTSLPAPAVVGNTIKIAANGAVSEQVGTVSLLPAKQGFKVAASLRGKSQAIIYPQGLLAARGEDNIELSPRINIGNPFIVSSWSGPTSNAAETQRLVAVLNGLGSQGIKILPRIFYVSSNRGFGKPEYRQAAEDTSDFTPLVASPQYEQLMATSILLDPDQRELLSELVRRVTGVSVESLARPQLNVQIRARIGNRKLNIVNEGFGSNQLIFLFWQILKAEKDSLIIIEEPENHLHPLAQSKLMDVLIEHARNENKQLLLCTHSDHIVAKALTSVASKGGLSVDDLAIYYFEKKGDTATARQLEIDSKGRVKGGLPGFFDAQIDEALSHLKALEGNK